VLSAALSGVPGNARKLTSTQIRDFLRTVSMFPPADCAKWRWLWILLFLPHT
jgi:hypothetical protein